MVRKTTHIPEPSNIVTLSGRAILRGMRRLIPVSLFVIPFGVGFGVAAIEQGLGPVQAITMSFFVFTATAQFAALDFLNEPIAYVSLFFVSWRWVGAIWSWEPHYLNG